MAAPKQIRGVGVSTISTNQENADTITDVVDDNTLDAPVGDNISNDNPTINGDIDGNEMNTGDPSTDDGSGEITDPTTGDIPNNTTNVMDQSGTIVNKPIVNDEKNNTLNNDTDISGKSKYAQTIHGMIQNYINTVNSNIYEASRDMSNNINMFKAIMEYALLHPETEVLEEVYTFFYSNKDVVLDPKYALQGSRTSSKMSKSVADRIETFYTLFRTITTNYAGSTNLEMARVLLGNHDPVIVFVQQKLSLQGK